MSKRMRNLAGKKGAKRSRGTRKKENEAIAMAIADAQDAFVAPTPYSHALNYLPNKTKATLRYAQKVRFSSSGSATGHWIFHANSCYDPDASGAGHQPRGFDQYMSMYDHFQVIGAKCRAEFLSEVSPAIVGITLRDTATPVGPYLDHFESRPDNNTFCMVPQNQEPKHLVLNYSQRKFFGTGELDDKYQGSSSGNPADGCFFHLYCTNVDDLTAGETVSALVIIDYIVVFTEPKVPPQS